MLLYRDESTLLPNKSTVSLTFGLIGVLTELADLKPNFFTRFFAYYIEIGIYLNLVNEFAIQGSESAL